MKKFLIKMQIMIITVLTAFSCRTVMDYPEMSKIKLPELLKPNNEEKMGIKLKINFPDYFYTEKTGIKYKKLSYDERLNKLISKNTDKFEERKYSWVVNKINNLNEKLFTYEYAKDPYGVILNKNLKPIKILRTPEYNLTSSEDDITLENCFYYIPDKKLHSQDEWSYVFTDKNTITPDKSESPRYNEINLKVDSRLTGYTLFKNIRCAVISSSAKCSKWDFNLAGKSKFNKKGRMMIYDIEINCTLYLDYKNNKIMYVHKFIKQVCKGTYDKSWGDSPEEAISNINKYFKDKINQSKTYCALFTYCYYYEKEVKK